MKKHFIKSVFVILALVIMAGTQSCKKKDVEEEVTNCFADEITGTYAGSGMVNGDLFTGTLEITKKGCTEINLHATSTTSSVDYSKTVNSLAVSDNGDYTGKTSDGKSVTISLSGSDIQVEVEGEFNFSGRKQ